VKIVEFVDSLDSFTVNCSLLIYTNNVAIDIYIDIFKTPPSLWKEAHLLKSIPESNIVILAEVIKQVIGTIKSSTPETSRKKN